MVNFVLNDLTFMIDPIFVFTEISPLDIDIQTQPTATLITKGKRLYIIYRNNMPGNEALPSSQQ